MQGRVKGLGRELIESFKEEKDEDDDEDHTNASKCVASGTERTREDTGKKDEQEEALLLLLHWIELVESRTSRGSQRKRRRTTTTTATRCGTVPGGVGVAPLLLTYCFFSPLRQLLLSLLCCCHLFCNYPIYFYFFAGEFPKRFDLETIKKICTI